MKDLSFEVLGPRLPGVQVFLGLGFRVEESRFRIEGGTQGGMDKNMTEWIPVPAHKKLGFRVSVLKAIRQLAATLYTLNYSYPP